MEPITSTASAEPSLLLTEVESKALLSDAGVPVARTLLAHDVTSAQRAAEDVGYPVVLKVVSRDISHKSDVGGVAVGLESAEALAAALETMQQRIAEAAPRARIEGFAVQHHAPAGTEVIVGGTRDPQFGPVVMFGLGGVFVEVLKDVAFRLAPLTPRDARLAVREIRGFPILAGVRGQPPVDLGAIEEILLRVSDLMVAHPDIAELDLNPVIAYPDGAIAVDARVIVRTEGGSREG